MHRNIQGTALAFALALAPLAAQASSIINQVSPAKLAELQSQQASRIATAHSQLLNLRASIGLDTQADFVEHDSFTNEQGRLVARFSERYQGYRVWSGEAIVHVEADGQVQSLTQGVQTNVTVAGTPKLNGVDAVNIALQDLAAKGEQAMTPKIERVVFPSSFTSGIVSKIDPSTNQEVVDFDLSTWAHAPSAQYVWAYEVKTLLANEQDGFKAWSYIIDGNTGAILRKWNDVQSDTAVTGTGASYYRGTVNLPTTQLTSDNSYVMLDSSRGSLPNPYLSSKMGVTAPGLRVTYDGYAMPSGKEVFTTYQNTTNAWGDGALFGSTPTSPSFSVCFGATWGGLCGIPSTNAETAGVDAYYGLIQSWDFYKNVFNRNGIDNQGTSTYGVTHPFSQDWFGNTYRLDNAYWQGSMFGIVLGDGTYPNNANGFKYVTELDVMGHELSHGVTATTANLTYSGESGGINEANSDFFGKMVQAYSARTVPNSSTIPQFATSDLANWQVAAHITSNGRPLRWMYKPSLDGVSPNEWYDGMDLIDVHYSSAPMNRALFFLANGASSDPTSDTYSAFLPSGMAGLGNDTAAHIWYKTLTENLTPNSDYAAARAGAISAADALYGVGSGEELAVINAFAGIGVGPLPGQPDPIVVRMPVVHDASSPIGGSNTSPAGILGKVQIFPTHASVMVKASVQNDPTNAGVKWSLGDAQLGQYGETGGVIQADGTWLTPKWDYSTTFLNMTAHSAADPLRYSKGRVLVAELDADVDTETDAIDLGTIAMNWGLTSPVTPYARPSGQTGSRPDWDLVWFNEAMTNAWGIH